MNRFQLLIVTLYLFSTISSIAQLRVQAERPNTHYEVGEIAYFNISGAQPTEVYYRIFYDAKTPNIEEGTIKVNPDGTGKIPFEASESGVFLCEVEQSEQIDLASIAFSIEQIDLFEKEPDDFDQFWENQQSKLADIPIDPILTLHDTYQDRTIYKVNFASIENRRVYGYLTVPNGEGTYPAILTLPPFGTAPNIVTPATFLSVQANAIVLAIGIHNADVDEVDPDAYIPNVTTDPSEVYMVKSILAGIRAIDYIHTLDQFDGENLVVNGVSQGGGLAMCVGGVDSRVDVVAFSNSALCQHSGLKFHRASGFPFYYHTASNGQNDMDEVNNAVQYVEAASFARRFRGAVYGTISHEDLVCPAATVYAAYHQYQCPKTLVSTLNLDHSTPNDYWIDRVPFYRYIIPSMATPSVSWLSNYSYLANAGEDQTVSIDMPANLSGIVLFDNEIQEEWPVTWEKVAGLGAVQFQTQNSRQTQVTFSQKGTYVLKFSCQIDDFVDSDQKRITAEDYITITVE